LLDVDADSSRSVTIARGTRLANGSTAHQNHTTAESGILHQRWRYFKSYLVDWGWCPRCNASREVRLFLILSSAVSNLSLAFSVVNCQLTVARRWFRSSFQPAISCLSFSQSS